MKALSLLPLVFGLFCLPLMAQEQVAHEPVIQARPAPGLPPAGPNRPAGVPADFVITPFGYFHPSCVLQLKKGEYRKDSGVLHHADGSESQISPCVHPHFSASGALTTVGSDARNTVTAPGQEPAISHSWIEDTSVTTNAAYGKEVSTWTVPPVPLMHDGQTIYLFPGLEDIRNIQSILQPVIGSYNGGQWTMASWNCCLAGTVDESNPIAINAGDTIVGTTQMTCAVGTTNCTTWNVTIQDQTINQSTALTATPSGGQTFDWAFGGVLEVYNVDQCLDYPPNASVTFTSLLYDSNFNLISSPGWGLGKADSSLQPQCNYGVTSTATQTTLQYGTTAPAFGLGISPAVGIAVNQGSSATGTIKITDINGFTGSVQVSVSNPPSGITAQLTSGVSLNTYILTLNATSAAAITGTNTPATVTLTASGSGVSTQTIPVSVIVNPPLMGGIGTAVDLTSAYNVYAFYSDSVGWPVLNAATSLDNSGAVYSLNQLDPPGLSPAGLNLNGAQFNFGSPNQENAVSGRGFSSITLPGTQFNELQLLGTAVNGMQAAQTITVTYTDNTTQTFTQTFDDWAGPDCTTSSICIPGELVAVTMPYNDTQYAYPRNDSTYYLYEYSFALNSAKTLRSLTLPNNRDVVVLAATLVNTTALPTFSPAGGTINSPQSVTISDSIAGATIYYTTDGSTPTTSSNIYGGAITVSSTETVKAIAVATGDVSSAVTTATYTLIPPNFAITGTAINISRGASTGNTSTITLTPAGGFTGAISLSCVISPTAANDPAACSVPASVTISGSGSQTVILTVTSTPATSGFNQPAKFFWRSVGGTTLACLLFVGMPTRRRRRWSALGILLLSFAIAGGAIGCSGSSNISAGGGGGGNPGTTPGAYVVTVTGTSGSITQKATVSLTLL